MTKDDVQSQVKGLLQALALMAWVALVLIIGAYISHDATAFGIGAGSLLVALALPAFAQKLLHVAKVFWEYLLTKYHNMRGDSVEVDDDV